MKKDSIYDKYTPKEIKDIYFHRIILFIMFFAVLAISAMRPIIEIYSVIGYMICLFLSAILCLSLFLNGARKKILGIYSYYRCISINVF